MKLIIYLEDNSVGVRWQVGDIGRVRPLDAEEKKDRWKRYGRQEAGKIGRVVSIRPEPGMGDYQIVKVAFDDTYVQPEYGYRDFIPLNKLSIGKMIPAEETQALRKKHG